MGAVIAQPVPRIVHIDFLRFIRVWLWPFRGIWSSVSSVFSRRKYFLQFLNDEKGLLSVALKKRDARPKQSTADEAPDALRYMHTFDLGRERAISRSIAGMFNLSKKKRWFGRDRHVAGRLHRRVLPRFKTGDFCRTRLRSSVPHSEHNDWAPYHIGTNYCKR